MEPLQYERTGAVFWNAGDLNRIEEWTAYLAGVLDSLGYQVLVRTRRWTAADIPWKPEIDRIRKNIQKLYAVYHYLPDFREITITGSMDFEQANVLEWDLHAIYTCMFRPAAAARQVPRSRSCRTRSFRPWRSMCWRFMMEESRYDPTFAK